jgi:hypothetical protein
MRRIIELADIERVLPRLDVVHLMEVVQEVAGEEDR